MTKGNNQMQGLDLQNLEQSRGAAGAAYVGGAYLLWGILPVYWKLLQEVPPIQILAHRIIWAFAFLLLLLFLTGKLKESWNESSRIVRQPRKLATVFIAAVTLNLNWFTYIWAINNNHIVQTSLGYYINPLVSIMLGIIFLKERLSLLQSIALFLAAAGVFSITLQYGAIPWVAVVLAVTFGSYGLFKKTTDIGAVTGLALETLMTCSFALPYLAYVTYAGSCSFGLNLAPTNLLLMGAGAVTAIPLVMFAAGARLLPLIVVGFLQYINPTITLLLGVLAYHETFTRGHLLAFVPIWLGLLLFSLSRTRALVRLEARLAGLGKNPSD